MTPMPDEPGWFLGVPKTGGRYLIIDAAYWHDRCATWIAPNGNHPGRWYPDGAQPLDQDGVVCFRPLPKLPKRPDPKLKDDSRTFLQGDSHD